MKKEWVMKADGGGRSEGIKGRDRGTDATHERFLGRIKQLIDRYQMKERRKDVK